MDGWMDRVTGRPGAFLEDFAVFESLRQSERLRPSCYKFRACMPWAWNIILFDGSATTEIVSPIL